MGVGKIMTVNIYNNYEKITANQKIYDAYNDFIISTDRNVFNKLLWRHNLYKMVQYVPGDIVECGVFKGSGMLAWLKMLHLYEPHSLKKVIGFDFFEPNFVESLQDESDKKSMKQVFDRVEKLDKSDLSQEGVERKILTSGFHSSKFELVKGDISTTSAAYLIGRSGFRISLLYLDLDLAIPTYDTMANLWDRISVGGIIVFDEYAHHVWSEADGVDDFLEEKGMSTHLQPTNIGAPTHYLMKS
jgi:hypothetical protein